MKNTLILFFVMVFFNSPVVFSQNFARNLELKTPRLNGSDVINVQEKLLSLGFTIVGKADGWFGPNSEDGVKQLQKFLSMNQNGIFTKEMWSLLFANDTDPIITEYFAQIKKINSMRPEDLTYEKIDLSGQSSEGGYADIYRKNNQIFHVVFFFFGETGKIERSCYFLDNAAYIVNETLYTYPKPFDAEHAELKQSSYFIKKIDTYLFSTNKFVKSNYDIDSLKQLIYN